MLSELAHVSNGDAGDKDIRSGAIHVPGVTLPADGLIGWLSAVARGQCDYLATSVHFRPALHSIKNIEQCGTHLNCGVGTYIAHQAADSEVAWPHHAAVGPVCLADLLDDSLTNLRLDPEAPRALPEMRVRPCK